MDNQGWSIISGKLPEGLKLNKKTGEIFGTPEEFGCFELRVSLRNECGYDEQDIRVDICGPPTITSGNTYYLLMGQEDPIQLEFEGTQLDDKCGGEEETGCKYWLEMTGENIKDGVVRIGGSFAYSSNNVNIQWTPSDVVTLNNEESFEETFEYTDDNPRTITVSGTGISSFLARWEIPRYYPMLEDTYDSTNGFTKIKLRGTVEFLDLTGNRLDELDISELNFCGNESGNYIIQIQVNNLDTNGLNNVIDQLPQLKPEEHGMIWVGFNQEVFSSGFYGWEMIPEGLNHSVASDKGWTLGIEN